MIFVVVFLGFSPAQGFGEDTIETQSSIIIHEGETCNNVCICDIIKRNQGGRKEGEKKRGLGM